MRAIRRRRNATASNRSSHTRAKRNRPRNHADAAAPIGFDRDRDYRGVRFEVQVRHHGCWETYGVYRDRDDAQRTVRMLERRGQDARIEVERR